MELVKLQNDWADFRNPKIDLFEIEMKVRDFYLKLMNLDELEEQEVLSKVYEAKAELESVRTLVINLISPSENEYVKAVIDAYYHFLENIGRVDKFLDESEEKTLQRNDWSSMARSQGNPGIKIVYSPLIINYIRKLDVLMQHLVYYPIKKASLRFRKQIFKDGQEVERDEDLFIYFVFLELCKSSESLGNITSEKTKTITRFQKSKKTKDDEEVPEIPDDPNYVEEEEEENDSITALEDIEDEDD